MDKAEHDARQAIIDQLDDESRKAGVYGKELDRPKTLVNPATGELVLLDAPDEHLAEVLDSIRELKSQLNELVGEVSAEVLRRQDKARNWTTRAGDYEIRGESDAPKMEWDERALLAALSDLVERGIIEPAAADAALEEVTTLKVKQKGINALRKSPGLREIIDSCGEEKPPERRRVSVRRKGAV